MATDEAPNLRVEVAKLRIPIPMLRALDRLYVGLQGVAQFAQAACHRDMRDRVPLTRDFLSQSARGLVRSQEIAHRVTRRAGFDQPRQYPLHMGIGVLEPLAPTADGAYTTGLRSRGQTASL